jgi:hypothetical protein
MKSISFFFLLFVSTLFINTTNAQKSVKCGLLTSFTLLPSSVNSKPSESDINLLNEINSDLKATSYMSKVINENAKKIMISLFTSGSYSDFVKQINASQYPFNNNKSFVIGEVNYSCFNFNSDEKNITRIVFNEPKLTLCIVVDVITKQKIVNYDNFYEEVIKRISFVKTDK